MNQRNAPEPDNILFEFFMRGNPELPLKGFRDATVITIYKKRDRENCDNYRGISFLNIASKLFARILLNSLPILAEDILSESQCGFLPSRGTIDITFCTRQFQGKCQEQQQPARKPLTRSSVLQCGPSLLVVDVQRISLLWYAPFSTVW